MSALLAPFYRRSSSFASLAQAEKAPQDALAVATISSHCADEQAEQAERSEAAPSQWSEAAVEHAQWSTGMGQVWSDTAGGGALDLDFDEEEYAANAHAHERGHGLDMQHDDDDDESGHPGPACAATPPRAMETSRTAATARRCQSWTRAPPSTPVTGVPPLTMQSATSFPAADSHVDTQDRSSHSASADSSSCSSLSSGNWSQSADPEEVDQQRPSRPRLVGGASSSYKRTSSASTAIPGVAQFRSARLSEVEAGTDNDANVANVSNETGRWNTATAQVVDVASVRAARNTAAAKSSVGANETTNTTTTTTPSASVSASVCASASASTSTTRPTSAQDFCSARSSLVPACASASVSAAPSASTSTSAHHKSALHAAQRHRPAISTSNGGSGLALVDSNDETMTSTAMLSAGLSGLSLSRGYEQDPTALSVGSTLLPDVGSPVSPATPTAAAAIAASRTPALALPPVAAPSSSAAAAGSSATSPPVRLPIHQINPAARMYYRPSRMAASASAYAQACAAASAARLSSSPARSTHLSYTYGGVNVSPTYLRGSVGVGGLPSLPPVSTGPDELGGSSSGALPPVPEQGGSLNASASGQTQGQAAQNEYHLDGRSKRVQETQMDYKPGGYARVKEGDELHRGRYEVVRKLGVGHFGVVWLAWDKQDGMYVAIKIVRSSKRYTRAALAEDKLLTVLQGPRDERRDYIVTFLDSFEEPAWEGPEFHICLVFEVMGMSLTDVLRKNEFNGLPIKTVKMITKQILTSLSYLHSLSIAHTDIKPDNILLYHSERSLGKILYHELEADRIEKERLEAEEAEKPKAEPYNWLEHKPKIPGLTPEQIRAIQLARIRSEQRRWPITPAKPVNSPITFANGRILTKQWVQANRELYGKSAKSKSKKASSSVSISKDPSPPRQMRSSITHPTSSTATSGGEEMFSPESRHLARYPSGAGPSGASPASPASTRVFSSPEMTTNAKFPSPALNADLAAGWGDSHVAPASTSLARTWSGASTDANGLGPVFPAAAEASMPKFDGLCIQMTSSAGGHDSQVALPVLPEVNAMPARGRLVPDTISASGRSSPALSLSASLPSLDGEFTIKQFPTVPFGWPKRVRSDPLLNVHAKLSDLGNAIFYHELRSKGALPENVCTRQYRPPENVIGAGYGLGVDVWALGCVVFEIITGDMCFNPGSVRYRYSKEDDLLAQHIELLGPFNPGFALSGKRSLQYFEENGELRRMTPNNGWALYDLMVKKYYMPIHKARKFCAFLTRMLQPDPALRASVDELLDDPWLNEFEDDDEMILHREKSRGRSSAQAGSQS